MVSDARVTDEPPAILPALQALQDELGYVPHDAIAEIAVRLNVSRADVFGVLTYYSDLRTARPPDVLVRICMGEACQSVGARDLRAAVRPGPGCEVRTVYCLGNCALGPTAEVNGRVIGRATSETVRARVESS
mgnify:FL=1